MGGTTPGDGKVNQRNVFALFPGIDTTPFGERAEPRGLSDDGWSAVPERTITDGTEDHKLRQGAASSVLKGRQRTFAWARQLRGTRPALAAGVAVLIGVGLGFAHSLLTAADHPTSTTTTAEQFATIFPVKHQATTGDVAAKAGRVSRTRHRTATDRGTKRPRRSPTRHAVKSGVDRLSGASTSGSVTRPVETTTTSAAVPASVSSGSTASSSGSSSASSASSAPVQRAGPTGRVSLIGAGTTPSG